jgi:hypothetical protein
MGVSALVASAPKSYSRMLYASIVQMRWKPCIYRHSVRVRAVGASIVCAANRAIDIARSKQFRAEIGRPLDDYLRVRKLFSMGLPMAPNGCRGRVVLLHVLASREQLPSAEWRSQGKNTI